MHNFIFSFFLQFHCSKKRFFTSLPMDSLLSSGVDENDKQRNDITANLILTNLLNTFPNIDSLQNRSQFDNSNKNGNSIFSSILDPFDSKPFNFNIDSHHVHDLYGPPGSAKPRNISGSVSPPSSSSSSQSIYCGRCENNACHRCLDCNDVFCTECVSEHAINPYTEKHNIINIGKITPIGINTAPVSQLLNELHIQAMNEPQCENHNEPLRFLCETCKKVVCQECTLKEHKDHEYVAINNITLDKAKDKLKAVCESSKLGIKFIKSSIDRAVTYSQSIERDSLEISSRVRKALRLLILGKCFELDDCCCMF